MHTIDHKNLGPHYHDWKDGRPVSDKPLTKEMLEFEPDHSALCDDKYSSEIESFSNPMELINNLRIKGHRLIDIIDDLEDVEPE